LKGMGVQNYRLLREAGVKDIPELARQDPGLLDQRLRAMSGTPRAYRIPDPAILRLWVREARNKVK
jgi:predicted RecB family nuclease